MPLSLPVRLRRGALRVAHALLRMYWFIVRPQTRGVKCVLTDDERVLLVRHSYGDHRWDLPGGSLRRHEQPRAAASREMQEELGIHIDTWRSLGQYRATAQYHHDVVDCFHAVVNEPQLRIDHGELYTAEWFARDHLPTGTGRWAREIIARLG